MLSKLTPPAVVEVSDGGARRGAGGVRSPPPHRPWTNSHAPQSLMKASPSPSSPSPKPAWQMFTTRSKGLFCGGGRAAGGSTAEDQSGRGEGKGRFSGPSPFLQRSQRTETHLGGSILFLSCSFSLRLVSSSSAFGANTTNTHT